MRGENFATQKIVQALCKIKLNKQKKLVLGNIYAKRDWGHAEDYVEAIWKILQYKKPDDFVIATSKQYTVKDFLNKTAKQLNMHLKWNGKGLKEKAFYEGKEIISISKKYFRPSEVDYLKGNYSKAKKLLKWKPRHNLDSLIEDMIKYNIENLN